MAQQTNTALDALAEDENCRVMDARSTDSEWDAVVWVHGMARTAGPALDPVQFWEAEGRLEADLHGSTEESDAYHVKEVQA